MNYSRKRPVALATGAVLVMLAFQAGAEQVLEEIMVTAQKREQSLQDVPVYVSAISANAIEAAGIDSVGEVQALVPALNVYTAGVQARTSIKIRGAGTGSADASLEPSVGIFIDGMYMPRSIFGLDDLVDVERVEVLMGPQGTLYGKNTNAGVISVTTKGAPSEFEGYVSGTFGDYSQQDFNLALASPIGDSAGFRIGVLSRSRDGTMIDANTGQDYNEVDNLAVRGQFFWDPTDNLSIRAIGYMSDKSGIRGVVDAHLEPTGTYLLMMNTVLGIKGTGELLDTEVGNYVATYDSVESQDQEVTGGSLQVDYDFDNGVRLSSLTSIQSWDLTPFVGDIDQTPLDLISTRLGSEDESFGQEFRLTSSGDDSLDWMLGAYYFDSKLQIGSQDESFAFFGQDMAILDAVLAGFYASLGMADPWAGLGFAGSAGHSFANWSQHESESYALYGQANWHISDATTLNFGLRYSDETKDFAMITDALDPNGLSYAAGGSINVLNAVFAGVAALGPVINMTDSVSDDSVTGMLSLNHTIGDAMFYGSVATGTKSGGFNGGFGGLTLAQRGYDSEETISYEIGGKFDGLFDGRARINVALFHTTYDDFQATTYDPNSASFLITNAGEQTTQGVDIDAQWAVTDNLTLGAAVEYLDATFDDFVGASCHPLADAPVVGVTPGGATACDFSGLELDWQSEWSSSLTVDYARPVGNSSEIFASVLGHFTSSMLVGANREPWANDHKEQVNARIGWRNDNWDIAVWGKNLTDDYYRPATVENTMSSAVIGAFIGSSRLSYNAWNNDPRTYGITAKYNF